LTEQFKVAVAVPSYKGFVATNHALSVQELLVRRPANVELIQVSSVGCGVLPRARNMQVATTLAHDCTHILFIDDDIGFNPEDVYRMIARDTGVIGAVPQRRNARWNDPPSLAVTPKDMKVYPDLGVAVPIEPRLPMALTLIKADVFRTIREKGLARPFIAPRATDDSNRHMADYFGYELSPAPEWSYEYQTAIRLGLDPVTDDGEDHYFCRRAAAAGYDIFIDLEAELRHYEGMVCHDYSLKKYFAENPEELVPYSEAAEQAA
jgi:hypothetical protein